MSATVLAFPKSKSPSSSVAGPARPRRRSTSRPTIFTIDGTDLASAFTWARGADAFFHGKFMRSTHPGDGVAYLGDNPELAAALFATDTLPASVVARRLGVAVEFISGWRA